MRALVLSCFLLGGAVWAQTPVQAPVTDVILHPGSATIVRKVDISAGMRSVTIANIPANIKQDSIRIDTTPGIVLGEVTTHDSVQEKSVNAAEDKLMQEIQAQEDQLKALDVEIKAAELVQSYLQGLSSSNARPGVMPDAKNLAAIIDTIGRSSNEALGKVRRIGLQKRAIELKLTVLKSELAKISKQNQPNLLRMVTITLQARQAGNLTLSYQDSDAGWVPTYRADLNTAKNTLELARRATIAQKTGENWKNVHITLATHSPGNYERMREPEPMLLNLTDKLVVTSTRKRIDVSNSNNGAFFTSKELASVPGKILMSPNTTRADAAYAAPTFETENTFSTEFEVPDPVNLAADGREVSITLARQTLAAKYYLRSVPRLEALANLLVETPRPEGVWPDGNVDLYRDGSYVGRAWTQFEAGERLTLAYGRDPLIKVARTTLKTDSSKSGFLESKNSELISDLFTITSAHTTPIDIQVVETSPVSTSDQILVTKRFEPQPQNTEWKGKRGVVMWSKTLAPKEKAKFQVDYQIDSPKDKIVSGLQR